MVTCGGMEIITWTWSGAMCPWRISTRAFWHSSRTMARTRSATSPRNTFWRYLVIQTIWRWMENVVWEPWFCRKFSSVDILGEYSRPGGGLCGQRVELFGHGEALLDP